MWRQSHWGSGTGSTPCADLHVTHINVSIFVPLVWIMGAEEGQRLLCMQVTHSRASKQACARTQTCMSVWRRESERGRKMELRRRTRRAWLKECMRFMFAQYSWQSKDFCQCLSKRVKLNLDLKQESGWCEISFIAWMNSASPYFHRLNPADRFTINKISFV